MALRLGMAVFGVVKLVRRPADGVRGRKWIWALATIANLGVSLLVCWGRPGGATPGPLGRSAACELIQGR